MLSSYEKEENPGMYDDMDSPWGNYTKWDNPGRQKKKKKERYFIISLYVESRKTELSRNRKQNGYWGLGMGEFGRCCSKVQTFK